MVAKMAIKKHLKFEDGDEELVKTEPAHEVTHSKQEHVDDDLESSDDDEAPEEEGLSVAKNSVEDSYKKQQIALKVEREQLKEKRKRQNQRFAEQQELKRQKHEEDKKHSLLMLEEELKENVEELNEEFFDELESQPQKVSVIPTKINFNDIDESYTEDVRTELKKQKRKTLKSIRKTTVKRGPVQVSLLSSLKERQTLAPKKEDKVLKVKDKWLRRRSINRK
ncbi:HEL236Cp [Eremothecium sinecaudum]|uniref:HEL236Cp n=1 Tax=Eremothecium sinecaudum TaxID=45286 RepID=A0A120K2B7_9SACH|nr:HEL236Cp [Eremothecium sinecaudum]AMD21045.1 HEL236Cp [Eremothecium sinecaudum]